MGLNVLAGTVLLLRRPYPIATALVISVIDLFTTGVFAAIVAIYSVVAFSKNGILMWLAALACVATGVEPLSSWPGAIPPLLVLGSLPVLFGLVARAQQAAIDSYRDILALTAAAQTASLHQARAEERARLAAEMHDGIGHEVSLIVLQAGALSIAKNASERTRSVAESIRRTGQRALEQQRDLVGVMRGSQAAEFQPTLVRLPQLIDGARTAGIPVSYTMAGMPAPLSEEADKLAFRVVQESLTNAGKHAPGAAVCVRVDEDAEGVRVTVSNTPPSSMRTQSRLPKLPCGGTGLAGLRERIERLGGTFNAEAIEGDGFEVTAFLPAAVCTAAPSE